MNNRRVLAAGGLGCGSVLFLSLLVVPIFFGASQFLFGGGGGGSGGCTDTSQAGAQPAVAGDAKAIPADYLALYQKAGKDYGIPWNVLAGIGHMETDHGRST